MESAAPERGEKLSPEVEARICASYLSGEHKVTAICTHFQITRSTLYWVLGRAGVKPNRRYVNR